ncbi:Fungal Zn2-Cys6 binuclear cluster domain-containing protein [Cladophialophora immunda]|nr:Fungal Zn2-Cys6 binuclear cluster domain-containing protein [Cladophialophora immunda]
MDIAHQVRFKNDAQALLAEASVAGMRNRPQLSCTPCRERKLKCDRARPCENCVKRRGLETCEYPRYAKRAPRTPAKAKERIARLENLFQELCQKNEDSPISNKTSSGDNSLVLNEKSMVGSETSPSSLYADIPNAKTPLRWKDILEDISEVKEYFDDHELDFQHDVEKLQTTKSDRQLVDLLCGIRCEQDVSALLVCLPDRRLVDKLIANYFNLSYMFRRMYICAMNGYDFMGIDQAPQLFSILSNSSEITADTDERCIQYFRFWKSPSTASKVWLGLLFAMIRLSAETLRQVGSNTSPDVLVPDEKISTFRNCALQCLALEDYTNGNIHGLQGLLTHLEAEYMRSLDSQANLWILAGTCVRVALMNGLHRDPSYYVALSPFESEMRRRLWLCIVHCDVLLSFQMGLPAMIPTAQTNTSLPKNLREEDFDEDATELPPSRPIDDATIISFYLVKSPLVDVFGRIASHLQTTHISDELMRTLDAELQAAWDSVPAYYRVRPMDESLIDPGYMIMRRYAVSQIHLTALCILHRKGLVLARSHNQLISSRKICIEGAMTLLGYQAIRHRETQPGGRLSGLRNMMMSITKNDYLLAAMLVCLDIHLTSTQASSISSDFAIWGRDRTEEMLKALETSYYVWKEYSQESAEALRASEALAAMLEKLRPEFGITTKYGASSSSSLRQIHFQQLRDPGYASTTLEPSNGADSSDGVETSVSQMFVEPDNIDWDELDRYFINSSPTVNSWMNPTDYWID